MNGAGINNYDFTDPAINLLGVPVVYYRLKQIYADGSFTYSGIVSLLVDHKSIVMLYPNPAHDKLNLTISTNKPGRLQARIIDNAGRVLQQQTITFVPGNSLSFDINKLAAGVYYLELKGETLNERKQFVKQ